MPDHLDFAAYFARHSAHAMQLPCSEAMHLPIQTKRWYVIKGPFVHAKTKEVFEQKTHVRAVQIFDGDAGVVKEWIQYVRRNLPAGVDMEVERVERVDVASASVSEVVAKAQAAAAAEASGAGGADCQRGEFG